MIWLVNSLIKRCDVCLNCGVQNTVIAFKGRVVIAVLDHVRLRVGFVVRHCVIFCSVTRNGNGSRDTRLENEKIVLMPRTNKDLYVRSRLSMLPRLRILDLVEISDAIDDGAVASSE